MNAAPERTGPASRRAVNRVDDNTTGQPSLDDYAMEMAEAAKDHGMETSAWFDREWRHRALTYIEQLEPGDQVDADDIRLLIGSSRSMGSVFTTARRARWIRCIGYTTSRSVPRRGGVVRVWERLP